jgi:hypothetical protein
MTGTEGAQEKPAESPNHIKGAIKNRHKLEMKICVCEMLHDSRLLSRWFAYRNSRSYENTGI